MILRISIATVLVALAIFILIRYGSDIRLFFSDLITPFATIARELRRMNELKTLELSERLNPRTGEASPVIVLTENPSGNDTEITFASDDPPEKGTAAMRRKLAELWDNDAVEDEEEE